MQNVVVLPDKLSTLRLHAATQFSAVAWARKLVPNKIVMLVDDIIRVWSLKFAL